MIYTLRQLCDGATPMAEINGKWVPGRSINHRYRSVRTRLREAWAVFTGKADAFVWPEGQ